MCAQFDPTKPVSLWFLSFITSFVLYGYLIPISLYVSLEMVKVVQSMVLINQDRAMYHAASDTPAKVWHDTRMQHGLGHQSLHLLFWQPTSASDHACESSRVPSSACCQHVRISWQEHPVCIHSDRVASQIQPTTTMFLGQPCLDLASSTF